MSKAKLVRVATKPALSLDDLSFGDNMRMSALSMNQVRMGALQTRLQQTENPSDDLLAELSALARPEVLENIFRETCAMFARVVVSVPADWWVPSAPDDLDLRDPDTYKWLKAARVPELQALIAEARNPDHVSGN